MLNKVRAEGIPIWVTLFLMLLVLFGVGMGAPALFGQGLMENHSMGWGGRQLGIAVASIAAIIYRKPLGYVLVFICHTFKETGDLFETLSAPGAELSTSAAFAPFIALELISLWLSYRATRQQ